MVSMPGGRRRPRPDYGAHSATGGRTMGSHIVCRGDAAPPGPARDGAARADRGSALPRRPPPAASSTARFSAVSRSKAPTRSPISPTAGRPRARATSSTNGWARPGASSSAANRDRFAADPEKYAPQYGGYCAWAVAQGYTAKIDPEAWRIVDGKLYLNYSKDVQTQWSEDIPGNITKGDANWPKLRADLAG